MTLNMQARIYCFTKPEGTGLYNQLRLEEGKHTMDAKVSNMSDRMDYPEQKPIANIRIALLTSCYTPVLPILVKQCKIDLLIHNQPIQQSHSMLHRLKVLAGRIIGIETDIIRWANQQHITQISMQEFSQSEIAAYISNTILIY